MITALSSDSLAIELELVEMNIAACRKTIRTAKQHLRVHRQSLDEVLDRKQRLVKALRKL
jgi:hypothetical protein